MDTALAVTEPMVKPELNPTWVTDGWKTHCNVLIQLCAHLQQQKIIKVQPAVLNESSKIFMVRVYEL
jgi:hypothetical protein